MDTQVSFLAEWSPFCTLQGCLKPGVNELWGIPIQEQINPNYNRLPFFFSFIQIGQDEKNHNGQVWGGHKGNFRHY